MDNNVAKKKKNYLDWSQYILFASTQEVLLLCTGKYIIVFAIKATRPLSALSHWPIPVTA